jgi:undecaprenyl-diphosphatase
MALLALLAYAVHRLANRRGASVAAMLVAGIAVLLVGLSRLYLGVHYPSDVIAGFIVGFCWAVCCALAMEFFRTPRSRHARTGPPGHTQARAGSGTAGSR